MNKKSNSNKIAEILLEAYDLGYEDVFSPQSKAKTLKNLVYDYLNTLKEDLNSIRKDPHDIQGVGFFPVNLCYLVYKKGSLDRTLSGTLSASELLKRIKNIIENRSSWEEAYDKVFVKEHMKAVKELGIEWYDPDTSYQEDVENFLWGVEDFVERQKSNLKSIKSPIDDLGSVLRTIKSEGQKSGSEIRDEFDDWVEILIRTLTNFVRLNAESVRGFLKTQMTETLDNLFFSWGTKTSRFKAAGLTTPSQRQILKALEMIFEDAKLVPLQNKGGNWTENDAQQGIQEGINEIPKVLKKFKVGTGPVDFIREAHFCVSLILECWGMLSGDQSLKDPNENLVESPYLKKALKQAFDDGFSQDPRGLDLSLFGDLDEITQKATKTLLKLKKPPTPAVLYDVSQILWMMSYVVGVRSAVRKLAREDMSFFYTLGPEWKGYIEGPSRIASSKETIDLDSVDNFVADVFAEGFQKVFDKVIKEWKFKVGDLKFNKKVSVSGSELKFSIKVKGQDRKYVVKVKGKSLEKDAL